MASPLERLAEYRDYIAQDQHRPQQKWLWDMFFGIFVSHSVMLSEIARALPEKRRLIHKERRLSRGLNSSRLNTNSIVDRYLERISRMTKRDDGEGIVVAVDRTDICKRYANRSPDRGMELVCGVYDGSEGHPTTGYPVVQLEAHLPDGNQCPLIYHAFSYAELDYISEIHEFLCAATRAAPYVGSRAWWTADRGFDALDMFLGLDALGRRWIIRLKIGGDYPRRLAYSNGDITDVAAVVRHARYAYTTRIRSGRRRRYRELRLRIAVEHVRLVDDRSDTVGPDRTLVIVDGYGKNPLVLLASECLHTPEAIIEAAHAYSRRWKCEEATRAMKDSRKWGVRMEDLRALRLLGVRRLVLIAALLYGFVAELRDRRSSSIDRAIVAVQSFGRTPPDPRYRIVRGLGNLLSRATRQRYLAYRGTLM